MTLRPRGGFQTVAVLIFALHASSQVAGRQVPTMSSTDSVELMRETAFDLFTSVRSRLEAGAAISDGMADTLRLAAGIWGLAGAKYLEVEDRSNGSDMFHRIGSVYLLLGELDSAVTWLQTAGRLAAVSSNDLVLGKVMEQLASVGDLRSQTDLARSAREEAIQSYRRANASIDAARVAGILASGFVRSGDLDRASSLADSVVVMLGDSATNVARSDALVTRGDVSLASGLLPEALRYYEGADSLLGSSTPPLTIVRVRNRVSTAQMQLLNEVLQVAIDSETCPDRGRALISADSLAQLARTRIDQTQQILHDDTSSGLARMVDRLREMLSQIQANIERVRPMVRDCPES